MILVVIAAPRGGAKMISSRVRPRTAVRVDDRHLREAWQDRPPPYPDFGGIVALLRCRNGASTMVKAS